MLAHARDRLVEAIKQQNATSEMLRIISNSPIQSVLDAVANNAARLCDADNAAIFRLEGNVLRLAASYGRIPTTSHAREGVPANAKPGTVGLKPAQIRPGAGQIPDDDQSEDRKGARPRIYDPVGLGVVDSLARPGSNVTGFIVTEFNFSGKWLEAAAAPTGARCLLRRAAWRR